MCQGRDDAGPVAMRRRRAGPEEGYRGRAQPDVWFHALPIRGEPREEQFTTSLAYNIIFALVFSQNVLLRPEALSYR